MRTLHNICGVDPLGDDDPYTGRHLAETISAGEYPEHDPDVEARLISQIEKKAQDMLEDHEVDAFAEWDSDNDRSYYQLGNGEVGIHWVAAQLVESGTIAEIAEHAVSNFRQWIEETKDADSVLVM